MTASTHLQRKPHARGTTISYLVRQDAIHQEFRRGLEKPSLLKKLVMRPKRWPSWVWRW